jgi:hypothetical protein
VKPIYEPGMKITYEPRSKRVVVAFRGRITILPESCETELQAVAAGESHCRRAGWNPADPAKDGRKLLRVRG